MHIYRVHLRTTQKNSCYNRKLMSNCANLFSFAIIHLNDNILICVISSCCWYCQQTCKFIASCSAICLVCVVMKSFKLGFKPISLWKLFRYLATQLIENQNEFQPPWLSSQNLLPHKVFFTLDLIHSWLIPTHIKSF